MVSDAIDNGAFVSSVNLAEIVSRLTDLGSNESQIRLLLEALKFETRDFGGESGWRAGLLRPQTRAAGLSLGDRACLALAAELGLPALTADRNWATLEVGVEVVLCR